jgi:hypothetical protein
MKDRPPTLLELMERTTKMQRTAFFKSFFWRVFLPAWVGILFISLVMLGIELNEQQQEQQQTPPSLVESKS